MEEIPFSPVSREEIHKLESYLLFATLFRPEVLEMIRNSSERLTWVDSLAVAAGAIAREKARMSVSEIAEELGRTEQTVRKHLKGETKAGQIVRETYELMKNGRLNEILSFKDLEEVKKLKEEIGGLRAENDALKKKIEEVKKLKQEFEELRNRIEGIREALDRIIS
jgi:probable regulatory domain-containing protein